MKKTILVVDDLSSVRMLVCGTLGLKGFNTIGASSGAEALKVLNEKANEIDLVLSDYNMPDCTGLELLKSIKAGRETAMKPVLFLTTALNPEKEKAAKEAGLSGWIKKPYQLDDFISTISTAIA